MNIVKIDPHNIKPDLLKPAFDLLRGDEVIIHPTETVYGFACRYSSEKAIRKTLRLKQRSQDQPFSIMVNGLNTILKLSGSWESWLMDFLKKILPDAITVLLPRRRELPVNYWNQFPLLGFRYPRHLLSAMLVEGSGEPLITTSANLSGQTPPTRYEEMSPRLGKEVPLIIDGGQTSHKIPSTIIQVDVTERSLRLVREGAVPWQRIEKCFAEQ